jgi:hypothetical protein
MGKFTHAKGDGTVSDIDVSGTTLDVLGQERARAQSVVRRLSGSVNYGNAPLLERLSPPLPGDVPRCALSGFEPGREDPLP